MKKLTIALVVLIFLNSCNSNPFGKYFNIPEASIQLPFAGKPIKVNTENAQIKSTNYEYAYNSPSDDSNYIYGAEVIEWKTDNKSNMKYLLSLTAKLVESATNIKGGELLETKWSKLKGKDCIIQKSKLNIPQMNGEVIMTGLIVANNKSIIQLHVYTPVAKADNKRIQQFFDAVKFD